MLNNIEMKQETAPPIEVPEKEEENDLPWNQSQSPDNQEKIPLPKQNQLNTMRFPFRHRTGHQILLNSENSPYFLKKNGDNCDISHEYENGELKEEFVKKAFIKCLKVLAGNSEEFSKLKEEYSGFNISFLVEYEMVAHIAIGIKSLQIRNHLKDYQNKEEIQGKQFPFTAIIKFMELINSEGNFQPKYPEDEKICRPIEKFFLSILEKPKEKKIDEIIMRCKKRIEDIKEVELSSYRNLQLQDFSIYKEFGEIKIEFMQSKINEYKEALAYFKTKKINEEFLNEFSNVIDTLNARVTKASKIVKAMELRLKNLKLTTSAEIENESSIQLKKSMELQELKKAIPEKQEQPIIIQQDEQNLKFESHPKFAISQIMQEKKDIKEAEDNKLEVKDIEINEDEVLLDNRQIEESKEVIEEQPIDQKEEILKQLQIKYQQKEKVIQQPEEMILIGSYNDEDVYQSQDPKFGYYINHGKKCKIGMDYITQRRKARKQRAKKQNVNYQNFRDTKYVTKVGENDVFITMKGKFFFYDDENGALQEKLVNFRDIERKNQRQERKVVVQPQIVHQNDQNSYVYNKAVHNNFVHIQDSQQQRSNQPQISQLRHNYQNNYQNQLDQELQRLRKQKSEMQQQRDQYELIQQQNEMDDLRKQQESKREIYRSQIMEDQKMQRELESERYKELQEENQRSAQRQKEAEQERNLYMRSQQVQERYSQQNQEQVEQYENSTDINISELRLKYQGKKVYTTKDGRFYCNIRRQRQYLQPVIHLRGGKSNLSYLVKRKNHGVAKFYYMQNSGREVMVKDESRVTFEEKY